MGELNKLTQACAPFEPPGRLNEGRSINEQTRFEIEDFLARHQGSVANADGARLEYCLLEHYAAQDYSGRVRTSLDLFNTPQYAGQLEPNGIRPGLLDSRVERAKLRPAAGPGRGGKLARQRISGVERNRTRRGQRPRRV